MHEVGKDHPEWEGRLQSSCIQHLAGPVSSALLTLWGSLDPFEQGEVKPKCWGFVLNSISQIWPG